MEFGLVLHYYTGNDGCYQIQVAYTITSIKSMYGEAREASERAEKDNPMILTTNTRHIIITDNQKIAGGPSNFQGDGIHV